MKAGYWLLLVLIIAIAATAGITYWLVRPVQVVETAAPEKTQKDGSKVAARTPNAKAKAKQIVPKGSKVERLSEITVQGATPEANKTIPGALPCPPVTVNTTLVRNEDGGKRLIVSSPDGKVVSAVDIPVETAAPPLEPKQWAAGLSYNPVKQTPGVWLERDIWRVRLGAEINQTRQFIGGPTSAEARIRLGVTF